MAEVSPLRRRMIEDMTIRNLSPATQQSYTYAVAKFSRHCGRSPARLGLEDVRAYQLYLIAQQRSWSHINQVVTPWMQASWMTAVSAFSPIRRGLRIERNRSAVVSGG